MDHNINTRHLIGLKHMKKCMDASLEIRRILLDITSLKDQLDIRGHPILSLSLSMPHMGGEYTTKKVVNPKFPKKLPYQYVCSENTKFVTINILCSYQLSTLKQESES